VSGIFLNSLADRGGDLACFMHIVRTGEAAVPKRESNRDRETILVVDDTDDVRRMICQILLSHGYNVLEASNGLEAVELTGACKNIHLVLTDVIMPQMNGHELAEHIRRTKPATRLMFMSGYSEDPLVRPLGHLSVFLTKPFTPNTLALKVREVLDAPGQDGDESR
jgi:two-component system, cell cycle sensor histidine kinase and response regulator CckA